MEISGFDYEMLSDTSFEKMESRFMEALRSIWANPVVDVEEDIEHEKRWLFFAKDQFMFERDDLAYELDENGEGCFSIIGLKCNAFNEVCASINAERKISSEIRIVQTQVWSYTIVLPALIEESQFSRKIYDLLVDALLQEPDAHTQSKFDAKPVQAYI